MIVIGRVVVAVTLDRPVIAFGCLGNVTYFDVNGGRTRARGITDSGTIAGWSVDIGGFHGFVTELDGTQCQSITIPEADLLAFPGGDVDWSFVLQGIKNSGEVVGYYQIPDVDIIFHSFIATPQ